MEIKGWKRIWLSSNNSSPCPVQKSYAHFVNMFSQEFPKNVSGIAVATKIPTLM